MKNFMTFHESKNNITFSVKKEFTEKVPNYKDLTTKELIENGIFNYLHNTDTFAVIDHKQNPPTENYFINGILMENKEKWENSVKDLQKEN